MGLSVFSCGGLKLLAERYTPEMSPTECLSILIFESKPPALDTRHPGACTSLYSSTVDKAGREMAGSTSTQASSTPPLEPNPLHWFWFRNKITPVHKIISAPHSMILCCRFAIGSVFLLQPHHFALPGWFHIILTECGRQICW